MKFSQTCSAIPQFDLYGEPNLSQDPGFVHIEDIAARCSKINWQIKPHRHARMLQIICMLDGELTVQLDESTLSLAGNWAIIIPPGTVHGFRFLPDTKGSVLTIADPLLCNTSNPKAQPKFDTLIHFSKVIEFKQGNALFDQLIQYLNLIKIELQQTDNGHDLMLEWLINIVLMTLSRQLGLNRFQQHIKGKESLILANFRQLLEENYYKQWTVNQYASAIHISSSTINRLCKQAIGISAKAIIQNRLLIEAKRRLIYTQDPLDKIAYHLGYKDPAYFSRFFKKMENVTPRDYRKIKHKNRFLTNLIHSQDVNLPTRSLER